MQTYYINSRKRIPGGTNSNFSYELPIPQNEGYNRVALLDIQIPKSFYNISAGRNSFIVDEDGNNRLITLTPGSYNRDSIVYQVESKLNDNILGWTYNITYIVDVLAIGYDGKLTFTVLGNSGIQPIFIFSQNSIWEQLGFSVGNYSFNSNSLKSISVINVGKESSLYLHSDICAPSGGTDVLQNIYAGDSSDYTDIIFHNNDILYYSKPFSGSGSSVFNFLLTDENGNNIDLNGVNMNLTILIFNYELFDYKRQLNATLETNKLLRELITLSRTPDKKASEDGKE